MMDLFFLTYQGQLVLNWAVLSIAAMGFRWTFLAGQFSMAHAALMGLGSYGAAVVAINLGWGVVPAVLAGALCAVLGAALTGLLSLRLNDLTLSIASLAVGLGVLSLIDHSELLGGPTGLIPPMIVEPWMTLTVLAVIVLASLWLDGARFGLAARAIADDPLVAASSGVNVRMLRLAAWIVGGAIVGLGGALFALNVGSISPHDFGFNYLTLILIAVLAGGSGTIVGPLVGAVFVVLLPEVVRIFSIDRGLVYGPLLVLLVLLFPSGIFSRWPRSYWRLRERLQRRGGRSDAKVPADVEPVRTDVPALSVQNISISFGGIHALSDVSFDVQPGRIHALIGPNGAGKTTLVNIVTGALRPSSGRILFGGEDVTRIRAYRRSRLGLARTFQAPRLLNTLTLRQNVAVGQWYGRSARTERSDVDEIIALLGLDGVRDRKVNSLNLAEQRKVEIARAFASGPRLLLLDEPTAGMNHVEALELIDLIVRLCQRWSVTVLLIEHNMNVVMTYSEEIVVVSFGKWIAEGTPEQIRQHPEVVNAYLGSSV